MRERSSLRSKRWRRKSRRVCSSTLVWAAMDTQVAAASQHPLLTTSFPLSLILSFSSFSHPLILASSHPLMPACPHLLIWNSLFRSIRCLLLDADALFRRTWQCSVLMLVMRSAEHNAPFQRVAMRCHAADARFLFTGHASTVCFLLIMMSLSTAWRQRRR